MKRMLTGLLVLVLVSSAVSSIEAAYEFTVTANPLWTNTHILLSPSDVVTIHDAIGSWSWAGFNSLGPEGGFIGDLYPYDEWIVNGFHGQLIGFIGPSSLDLNAVPRVILQDDSRLFEIGAGSVTLSGLDGTLWLGFNDGYSAAPGCVEDNAGSIVVQVDIRSVPEPASLAVWSFLSMAAIGCGWWRKRRSN